MVMATQTVPPSLPVGNRSVVPWTLNDKKQSKLSKYNFVLRAYFADHRRELIEEAKAIVSQRKRRTAEAV
jgi:hypothetical protein